MKNRRFSIITVNRNNADALRRTVDSVCSQTFKEYEYIIIDGASTDNSLDVINEYEEYIDYFVSEPDRGIYNAMNKAVRAATGEYVLFMNAGDVFASVNVLSEIDFMNPCTDFIFGATIYNKGRASMKIVLPERLSFFFFFTEGVCHQSAFIRRSLFAELGEYDETVKITADWQFFILALAKAKKSYVTLPLPVSIYDMTGYSSQKESEVIIEMEKTQFLKTQFPFFYIDYCKYVKLRHRFYYDIMNRLRWKLFYNIPFLFRQK